MTERILSAPPLTGSFYLNSFLLLPGAKLAILLIRKLGMKIIEDLINVEKESLLPG